MENKLTVVNAKFLEDLRIKDIGDVLIVGGGISGIQAALDLASSGFKVFLLDSAPTIGGHMAMLDKTFPTNDCSMCIESPKFVECSRHPNIEIISYSEVDSVKGKAGDFDVTIVKKPRYVDEDKCTGCTTCVEYCPVKSPDPFNQGISKNKAIHIYFAQAIPLVSYIDENCLYLKDRKCGICKTVCKTNAIDFNQKPEYRTIKVGAIILSPGFSPYEAQKLKEYGYGKYENVVTSLDYERLLCATGPYEGEILRKTDLKHPHKIAWIQCIGSRSVLPEANSYCSSVCCAYTQKQVILTKDHDPDAECTVFYIDIRSYGKDFERFFQRASKLSKTRFIRSAVSIVGENPFNKNLTLRYSTFEGDTVDEEFDMVVLSIGLNPPKANKKFSEIFCVNLNEYGFCNTNEITPMETNVSGIYVSGCFQRPMDIPEAVFSASAAMAKCSELLSKRRGKLSKKKQYPQERNVANETPRVGVYVCHCGANIGRVVDVKKSMEEIRKLENVVHVEENLFICSTEAAAMLVKDIKERQLNRVVVAACTPRTHEPLFRETLREAGLNQYYFEFANIREHCSWVHSKEKEAATEKSIDLIRMAVARATRLEALEEFELPVDKKILIVGGGVAGLNSAISLAKQGFHVYLVEKEKELGGMLRKIRYFLNGIDPKAYLDKLVKAVYSNPLIHVFTDATVSESSGFVGNFYTKINIQNKKIFELKHGAILIAVGATEYKPIEYLYGQNEHVLTNLELEEKIFNKDEGVLNADSIAFIQCVGCRNEERNYCSRVCCSNSIKLALKLKEHKPNMDIYVIYRDIRTYGFLEQYYKEASEKSVRFIRYEPQEKPTLIDDKGKLKIKVKDYVLNKILEIDIDYLSLASAVIPNNDFKETAKLFKVNLGPDNFFQEAHVKLRPVDCGAEGVYLAGSCHYPKHLFETINQAVGAAGRIVTLVSKDTVIASGSVCVVDEKKCIGCGNCVSACTYGAIELKNTRLGKKAIVNPVLCKGDGLCNSKCPSYAIKLKHYTEEQILSQIESFWKSEPEEESKEKSIAGV